MRKLFILLFICSVPTWADAADSHGHRLMPPANHAPAPQLSSCALNGTCAISLEVGDYSEVIVYYQFTHANNGALTFTITVSYDQGTTYVPIDVPNGAAASTLTHGASQATASLSADSSGRIKFGILGETHIKITVTHGGSPDANDLISAQTRLVAD